MSGATPMDSVADLMNMLESPDLSVAQEIKQVITENLQNNPEVWLLNGLVDYFAVSNSKKCLEILSAVREPHDKQLLDRLLEQLKGNSKLQALTILGHLIIKQPPWIHKITSHPILNILFKTLKVEVDVPILMSGVLAITSLLPLVPVNIADHLTQIFDVFCRLAAFNLKKPSNVPDIYIRHLKVGIYCLFHRLYGMYPCHFLTHLRSQYSRKENAQVFEETIKPMLEKVRMHPLLVTANKDKEVLRDRWKQQEVHDIVVDCAKLSLDLLEGTPEELHCPVLGHQASKVHINSAHKYNQTDGLAIEGPPSLSSSDVHLVGSVKPLVSSVDINTILNPANSIGLLTPPLHDSTNTSDTNVTSQGGTRGTTPSMTPHAHNVAESPLPHDVIELRNKAASHRQPGKRLSAISLSLAGKITTPTGDGSVPPSPLKPDFTSEPPLTAQRMQAIRKLNFQYSEERLQKERDERFQDQDSTKDSHPFSKISTQPDIMKKESAPSTPKTESKALFPLAGTSKTKNVVTETTTAASRTASTSATTAAPGAATSAAPATTTSAPTGAATSTPTPAKSSVPTSSSTVSASSIDASAPGADLAHSGPSVHELPNFIETLNVNIEEIDKEVSELTSSRDDIDTTCSSVDSEHDPHLTAESVQAFMKTVNRIRFNSMNVSQTRLLEKSSKVMRSSSCPDLETEEDLPSVTMVTGSRERSGSYGTANKAAKVLPIPPACSTITTSVTTVTSLTVSSDFSVPSPLAEEPIQEEVEENEEASKVDMETCFPYQHMFGPALPFAPFIQCYNCSMKELDGDNVCKECGHKSKALSVQRIKDQQKPFFLSLSPAELLDRHIQLGGQVHEHQSHLHMSKTHAHTEEVETLKGQILLVHNQLMYERHRRELYARRNRRLLRRIVNTVSLEEQNAAMQDQLMLQEREMQNLKLNIKLQKEQYDRLKSQKSDSDLEKELQHQNNMRAIEKFKTENITLETQIEHQTGRIDALTKDLQRSESQRFTLEKELDSMRTRADFCMDLQDQVTRLNRELLLMGELQSKYQQRLVNMSSGHNPKPEMQFILDTYKNDLNNTKQILDQKTTMLDATTARLGELEELMKTKDMVITEQKKVLEEVKSMNKARESSIEEKYTAERHIQLALEGRILQLQSELELLKHKPVKGEIAAALARERQLEREDTVSDSQEAVQLDAHSSSSQ